MSNEFDHPSFHSALGDCSHCGRTDAVVPSLEEQVDTIVENLDYESVIKVKKLLGCFAGPETVEGLKKFVRDSCEDVIRRCRETLTAQCCGSCGWYIEIEHGVVSVRFTVTEWGWMP